MQTGSPVDTPRAELHPVPPDLLDGWGSAGMLPRHQRLLVAGYALTPPGANYYERLEGLRRARDLYATCAWSNDLIDRPSRLSVAGIVAELQRLLDVR